MSDNLRPKWMDGPGADELVDYDLVRDWAWETDDSLDDNDYEHQFEMRAICRELLRVNEALRRVLHGESSQ